MLQLRIGVGIEDRRTDALLWNRCLWIGVDIEAYRAGILRQEECHWRLRIEVDLRFGVIVEARGAGVLLQDGCRWRSGFVQVGLRIGVGVETCCALHDDCLWGRNIQAHLELIVNVDARSANILMCDKCPWGQGMLDLGSRLGAGIEARGAGFLLWCDCLRIVEVGSKVDVASEAPSVGVLRNDSLWSEWRRGAGRKLDSMRSVDIESL